MSKWPTSNEHPEVLVAASHWREACLLRGGSAFTDRNLWTAEGFAALKERILDQPDVGQDEFAVKLRRQLEGAPPAVIQLAAEIMWLLRLFPATHDIGVTKKRELVTAVWSWSGEIVPDTPRLKDPVLEGVGGTGHAFRSRIWHQLKFLLLAMTEWTAFSPDRRQNLLFEGKPGAFCDWLTGVAGGATAEMRHALLFLIYPDQYERICSGSHKRKIYDAFAMRVSGTAGLPTSGKLLPCMLDSALLDIRRTFEKERGTVEFDFYLPDIKPLWAPPANPPPVPPPISKPPSTETLTDPYDGVFVSRETWDQILLVWRSRQNIVLQGPPGVGKSFVADRLAHALADSQGASTIARAQFHPSTSYEDFVQGYRPDEKGSFVLRDGPFVRFCSTARDRPEARHVFVIDELNRGNLARIFGELMMLIEADKRGSKWEMPLAYALEGAKPFYVPKNVYIIGLMNTADRSLAMIDYALRRRFAFFNLVPAFSTDAFEKTLLGLRVTEPMVARIRNKMEVLNKEITQTLGAGYAVGHSYFTEGPAEGENEEDWFNRVIAYEVAPLLEEYWFDALPTAAKWREFLEAD